MKIISVKRLSLPLSVSIAVASLLALDVGYAGKSISNGKFCMESEFVPFIKHNTAKVAISRSDDPALKNPVPLESELTYQQIEDMTRRAVDLVGGFKGRIHEGDKVLIKPNLVEPQASGIGEITDVRVVKAVARLVNEVAPGKVEIIIGEGSANPMDYEMPYNTYYKGPGWKKLWDVAGYQELLTDPDLKGINFRLQNLNGPWEDLVFMKVPGGAYQKGNEEGVWVHKDVLAANFHITVPVMKIHTPMTVALKNNIGLYPSTRYGFFKSYGVPQDGRKFGIHPSDPPLNWMEEAIADIARLSGVDFVVVDAVMCLERQKSAMFDKERKVVNQVRRNMILAGDDMVAVDNVAARLMGLNPDDVSHIDLAAKAGLGVNDIDKIQIVGSTVEKSMKHFRKSSFSKSSCNRTWLLRGLFDASGMKDPLKNEFIPEEASLKPEAGKEGWSESVYFFDDRIDLGAFFGSVDADKVAYAFTYFDSPKDRKAEIWLGYDDPIRIYLNGREVYTYDKQRSYTEKTLTSEKVTVPIRKGENTLLVKAMQSAGRYDFALNICEPENDPAFNGSRVAGMKFRTLAKVR
jgi:uncharacterized protein (DUF362 family)